VITSAAIVSIQGSDEYSENKVLPQMSVISVLVFEQILQFTTTLTLTVVRLLVRLLHSAKHDCLVDYRKLPQMPGEQKVRL